MGKWYLLIIALIVLSPLAIVSTVVEAQGINSFCDPSGADNDLLYCVFQVEPRFGGFYVDPSDPDRLRV